MKNCSEIQQIIASLEFNQLIEDKDILRHITTCQQCQDYQVACDEMNQVMNQMSDFDADEALVESTLSSILSLQEESKEAVKPKSRLNIQWASALAASFMLVSLIALFPYNSVSNYGLFADDMSVIEIPESVSEEEKTAIKQRKEALNRHKVKKTSDFDFYSVLVADEVTTKNRQIPIKSAPPSNKQISSDGRLSSLMAVSSEVGINLEDSDAQLNEVLDDFNRDLNKDLSFNKNTGKKEGEATNSPKIYKEKSPNELKFDICCREEDLMNPEPNLVAKEKGESSSAVVKQDKPQRGVKLNSDGLGQVLIYPEYENNTRLAGTDINEGINDGSKLDSITVTGSRIARPSNYQLHPDEKSKKTINGKLQKAKKDQAKYARSTGYLGLNETRQNRLRQDVKDKEKTFGDSIALGGKNAVVDKRTSVTLEEEIIPAVLPLNPAKQYLAEMSTLDTILFQTASGYWANTYLPGDSHMRLIEAKLEDNNSLNLSNGISQNIQPFDSPNNSALAVYLNSDVAYVHSQKPTRMRLQVGIQASDRKGGQRSAMNIGLIFDLTNQTLQYATSMKELLLELLKSKQPGDNISLTVAGVNGGMMIKPQDFRHGPIQVALNSLFKNVDSKNMEKQQVLSLKQALTLSSASLQSTDDSSANLGSSVVMLFSANNIGTMPEIETMIHNNAVNGITLSTVSLGQNNHQQLKKLALAGQGNARILQSANDAKRVIDAELLASSRAVARAVRLRIRLAKGVKLIKVIDSYNLNEKQSQRVREAEQSLDKRLSKNLGITADRGEDEEGIQIVIPSFFAGDTHVVLLDVMVENKGSIADVSMRYKDLLYLRNAVTRKQLNLDDNIISLGPLQFNVMKNVLASRFANSIKKASESIRNGDSIMALSILVSMQKLYQSMRIEFPIWNSDAEILNDEKLIQQYIKLLNSTSINDVEQINYIIDSLQYISWRKQITLTQ